MPTTVLNAYSSAYPAVSNRIRATIASQSAPLAIVASDIDTAIGHPVRIWSFPGIPRDNYIFSLDEIDGSGNVVTNLAYFDVVPSDVYGDLTRDDEQIQVDFTNGFVSNSSIVVFDGSETSLGSGLFKPDYRGWDIVPSELTGRGILVEGLDYSWDKVIGTFTLLQASDEFQNATWFNIHFNPVSVPQGNSYPTLSDFQIELLTSNITLDYTDMGKMIIIEPILDYIEVTLPDPATVVDGRPIRICVTDSEENKCIRIKPFASELIRFLRGNIYIMPNESIAIYKYTRSVGVYEWRVYSADGNFRHTGEVVGDDAVMDRGFGDRSVFNKQLLDGSSVSVLRFARLYNDFVLNLPIAQVVAYSDWLTGNNRYFYSLSNGTEFHVPDRRGIFERNNNTGKAGDFGLDQVGPHVHPYKRTRTDPVNGQYEPNRMSSGSGRGLWNGDDVATLSNDGLETMPKHYLINKYVLL